MKHAAISRCEMDPGGGEGGGGGGARDGGEGARDNDSYFVTDSMMVTARVIKLPRCTICPFEARRRRGKFWSECPIFSSKFAFCNSELVFAHAACGSTQASAAQRRLTLTGLSGWRRLGRTIACSLE